MNMDDLLKVLPLSWLAKTGSEAVQKVADLKVKGEDLSSTAVKVVQTVDVLAKIWGPEAVQKSETDIDDAVLNDLLELTADTAAEGGFGLYNPS